MANVTCHVLDTTRGCPAQGMEIALLKIEGSGVNVKTSQVGTGTTDAAGRCDTLTRSGVQKGTYKLVFGTGDYYKALKTDTFWPLVEINFNLTDEDEAYHIPLLVSPFSFTSYKGQHGGAKKKEAKL